MFDIGFVELMLVAVIGLLVLGPERLPRVARSLGRWAGKARMAFNNLKSELEREAYNADMKEKFKRQLEEMGLTEEDLQGGRRPPLPPGDLPGNQASGDDTGDRSDSGDRQDKDTNP